MKQYTVTGYQTVNSKYGTTYLVHALSDEPIDTGKGKGLSVASEYVDERHLKKHNIDIDSIVGRHCSRYNIKEGDTWKSGFTFKT